MSPEPTELQDSDFAGDLEDSTSTSEGTLCIFGSRTLVPSSWMYKKQTAVSQISSSGFGIFRNPGKVQIDFGEGEASSGVARRTLVPSVGHCRPEAILSLTQ